MKIKDLNSKMNDGISSWHKITTLIKLRENLLGKIGKITEKTEKKQTY